jgi:hypothetical protein
VMHCSGSALSHCTNQWSRNKRVVWNERLKLNEGHE